ncbi:MAG: S41 family peptidase [Candidatus Abyssobacteria bacterium SURF_5]|uniref:S41 family peptidase n=1 Tax=Abyssobacteria bacterium (strain SURF_5) TaxID=2093360 RepID=A0A3A4NYW2_ABYX5|nr:MAG: S41 family peptidase [Candidatus Abyssubacteria bacterium SURF_5]
MQRNRSQFVLFLVSVLMLGLLFGNSLSGYVAAQTGSTYTDLEIFSDALSIVQNEYVEQVPTKTLIYGAMKGMLDGLDPHSQFMPPDTYKELKVETEGHFGGLGIVISLDENKILTVVSPIEDTPAFKAGVQANDKIIKIEGESTQGLVLEEAVKKLRGPKGSKVAITVLRLSDDPKELPQELEFVLTRADIQIRSVTHEMIEEKIGRIRLREFSEKTALELHKSLEDLKAQGMRSLVLDLRNNPGGLLNVAADVADEFFEKGQLLVYTESRHADQNLKFKAKSKAAIGPDIPIVVLVNGGSASASEIVAGALKDTRRAVIMGEKTFGKGSVQSIIPLSDGSALRLTTAKYLTPGGSSINGTGILPDIEVKLTKEQMTQLMTTMEVPGSVKRQTEQGEQKVVDIQLQRAIELLQGYDIFKTLEQNISVAKMNIEEQGRDAGTNPESAAAPANEEESLEGKDFLIETPGELEEVPLEK